MNNQSSLEKVLCFCIALCPLFIFTIKGWMNWILFITAILCIFILIKVRKNINNLDSHLYSKHWALKFSVVLSAPICAIFISQVIGQSFLWHYYDAPFRLLICIPILYAMIICKVNVLKPLSYVIPTTVFINLIDVLINPNIGWGPDRVTSYLADPLTFGSINVMLGLLSLTSINLLGKDSWFLKIFKLLGFLAGIYLSINSGSKTGWLAIPFILTIWGYQCIKTSNKNFALTFTLALALVLMLSICTYQYSPVVHLRSDIFLTEALSYQWNHINPDTSTAMRVSFFRIALFLFTQNPLSGWGDTGFGYMLNNPELTAFASEYTRYFPLSAGFHNEITTNMVRSGVWGLISSALIFLVPTWFFTSNLSSRDNEVRKLALVASGFIISAFFNAMSTEILNLKYTASFYGLMITIFAGSLIILRKSESTQNNS